MFGLELDDWAAIGVIVTGLGVMITGLGVIASSYLTRRGLTQDQQIAENTASRSEAAAALTEDYTRRIVDALERIAREGLGAGGAPQPQVRWELVHHDGDRYRLTNVGNLIALDVKVEAHDTLSLMGVEGGPDLQPGEALTFMAIMTLGTKNSTITVRWREDGKTEECFWRYPLPGRPRR